MVAVKEMQMPLNVDPRTRAQIKSFEQEINLMKKLQHEVRWLTWFDLT